MQKRKTLHLIIISAVIILMGFTTVEAITITKTPTTVLPVNIPDNGCAGTGVSATFDINVDLLITDVNLGVNIDHNDRDHLEMNLSSPTTANVFLATDIGGNNNNNNLNVLFDSDAGGDVPNNNHATSPNYEDIARPENNNALDTFDGESSLGTWTFFVCDDQNGTAGNLTDLELIIEGTAQVPYQLLTSAVSSSSDDAEEYVAGGNSGDVDTGSSDLEMIDEDDDQIIGMRFKGISIPSVATITSAHIDFVADGGWTNETDLLFFGQDTGNTLTFQEVTNNISDRTPTTATSSWDNVPEWISGTTYTSPDLTTIIQELIDRGDWAGDSLVIMVTGGSGDTRRAESFDGIAGAGPVLNITFTAPDATLDFGDAPDLGTGTATGDYQTKLSDSGPSHVSSTDLFIGNLAPDSEYDGNPTATAKGDDANGNADEDEPQNLIFSPGEAPVVKISATNQTGSTATLSGWIDLNSNGVFETATEGASVSVPNGTNLMTLTFPLVPSGLPPTTYMRLRITTDAGPLTATGAASDGEVEDHRVFINGDATTGIQQCYAVADGGNWLITTDPISAVTDDDVNEGLGAAGFNSIEAMVWDLGDPLVTDDETLYAADVNRLVRLLPLPRASIGTFNNNVNDADGLAIDWQSVPPVFYGSGDTGNTGPNNIGTGHYNIFIYDPTNANVTAVSRDIVLPTNNTQIDDIAWDPINRRLLAVTNDGSDLSHLVEFDLSNFPANPTIPPAEDCGSIVHDDDNDPGTINVILEDTEGLSFTRPGELFIVTGAQGPPATRNSLWKVPVNNILSDCSTGTQDIVAERIGAQNALETVPSGQSVGDYEAVGCGNTFSTSNASLGNRVWLDEDGDGEQDGGEDGIGGVTVYLCQSPTVSCDFFSAIRTAVTDANGGYLFTGIPILDYIVAIDTATVPTNLVSNPTYDEDGVGTPHVTEVSLTKIEEEYLTADFGYNWNNSPETETPPQGTTGSIGDRVWNDADADGIQDSNEAGINAVIVNIYTDPGNDGVFEFLAGTTTTDANGNYVFDGLAAGAYVVRVDDTTLPNTGVITWTQTGDPDDFAQTATLPDNETTSPIILAPGDVFINADFGYQGDDTNTHTIGDTIFLDANADGTQNGVLNSAEPGIANVTVTLLDASGNPIAQDITDSDGHYSFPGLPDGTYTVKITDTNNILGALNQSADPDAILDSKSTVNLTVDDLNQDFGFKPKGHNTGEGLIGDTVFIDINGNGTQEAGEPGIEGVIVELIDTSTGIVQQRATTDENGNYQFGNLTDDTYTVRVDTSTLPNTGVGLTNTADPDGAFDNEADTTITGANNIDLDQDFGYQVTNPNIVGGTLWNDNNADGTQDVGETVIFAGVTVSLFDENGNLVGVTTTDGTGHYEFTGLPNGTYTISVTDDGNVLAGHWLTDGPNDNNDLNSQPVNYSVTVSGNDNNQTGDFGYYVNLASAGNIVFRDDNNNGIRNAATEPGIPMVPVTLTITYPNMDEVTLTTLTDGAGYYSFENLLADDSYTGVGLGQPLYRITVGTVAAGFLSTYDGVADPAGVGNGTDDNADNDQGEDAFPVKGSQDSTNDFGFVPGGSIGNRVWLDLDSDGVQDANEDGIANRTVRLTPPAGVDLGAGTGVSITTTTDSEGKYIFTNVPLANGYSVTVLNPPTGLIQTYDEDDGFDLTPTTANSTIVNLTQPNEEYLTADFGYIAPSGSIGDYIWADANGDGQQDPNEIGMPNVDVYICLSSVGTCDATTPITNVIAMTTTDATGHYLFTGINLTDYHAVHVDTGTLPSGYTLSGDPDTVDDSQTTVPSLNTSNGINLDADFGYLPPDNMTHFNIGDTIYQDLNGDGSGIGDPGIPGVTVQLFVDTTVGLNDDGLDNPDTPIASAITDINGNYLFPSLPPGVAYSVLVTDTNNILNGYVQTGDPDAVLDNQSTINSLTATDLDQDFGYRPMRVGAGIIGDKVYNSLNGQGFEGVTVRLVDADGNLIDSVVTDENGNYLFTGLDTSATYDVLVVTSTLPNGGVGWNNNVDPDGGNNSTSEVDLSSGSGVDLNQDFGYLAGISNTIKGTVWRDDDGNGELTDGSGTEFDETANGINNVTVVLLDTSGNIVATTTTPTAMTDGDGDFTFTGLADGTYYVVVTDDSNELANLQHTNGLLAGDNNVDNYSQDDTGYSVTVSGGEINVTADFGYKPVVTTPITLASFKAIYNQNRGETIINWSTLTETGNIGFDLYYQTGGIWVKANDVMIASKQIYSTTLVTYKYIFAGEASQEWAIVDVDIKGRRQSHGVYNMNKLYGYEESTVKIDASNLDRIKEHHKLKSKERSQQDSYDINQYIKAMKNKVSNKEGAGL